MNCSHRRRGMARWNLLLLATLCVMAFVAWLGRAEPAPGGVPEKAGSGFGEPAEDAAAADLVPLQPKGAAQEAERVSVAASPPPLEPAAPAAETSPRSEGLYVRAVGPDGEAVRGVAVDWMIRTRFGGVHDSPIRGVTDKQGILKVKNGEERLEQVFGETVMSAYSITAGLRCAMPFESLAPTDEDEAPGVTWLAERPEPGAVIDVQVPAYGFVRFTWEAPDDPRGGKLDASSIQIRRHGGDHFPGWRFGSRIDEGESEFTFGPVGIGWEVWGSISAFGMKERLGSATGKGPTAPGETVTIPIPIEEPQRDVVAVRGRVEFVSEDIKHRRNGWIRFGPPDTKRAPRASIAIGEDKRFEILIARSALPQTVTLFDSYVNAKWIGSSAVPEIGKSESILELGVIAVAAVPEEEKPPKIELASGRVVDANGAPIQHASVSVYGHATQVGNREVDPGRITSFAFVHTNKEGRFEASASVALVKDTIQIHVSEGNHQNLPMQSAIAGATGLEYTLTRGVDVRFRIQIPVWALLMEQISMELSGRHSARAERRLSKESDGPLPMVFTGVAAGTQTFKVELGQGDWLLHGQEVDVTESGADLGLIDLADALRICRLRLVDAGGTPVDGGYITVLGSRAGKYWEQIDSVTVRDDGEVFLLVPTDAQGLRVQHFTAGSADVPAHAVVRPSDDGEVKRVQVVLGP